MVQLMLKHCGKCQIGYVAIRSIATNQVLAALGSILMWVRQVQIDSWQARGMKILCKTRCKSLGRSEKSQGGDADKTPG